MDYEKKYKEALGWMQSIYDGLHGATKEDAEHYFPELKENEDERIRRELIAFLIYYNTGQGKRVVHCDDWISWLEKQGEQQHTNSKDDERLKKTTVAFLKDFAEQGYENAVECIDWLEKQGKQKTEIEYIYPKFRIGDVIEQIQPNGNS